MSDCAYEFMLSAYEARQALEEQAADTQTPNWRLEFSDGTYDNLQTPQEVAQMCFDAVSKGVELTEIVFTKF
jgi:hypothetical protein|tara:strand:- start:88 stop:303 length:216 start_codon:yes stop_codon:yes gene_type:complete